MSGGVGVLVGYDIGGGGLRLFDGEHLRVSEDGDFELWLLSEAPAVGRFRGRLAAASTAELARLAGQVLPAPDALLPPGGHAERWVAGAASIAVPAGRTPGGAWGDLVTTARALMDAMTEHPAAALALSVADDWRSATLRSVGSEGHLVAAEPLTVLVAAWSGYYDPVGTWDAPPGSVPVPGDGAGSPGWSMEIPLAHDFAPGPGRVLHVKVGLTVLADGARARLVATVAPPMADPEA
jgi:hypothetical protein